MADMRLELVAVPVSDVDRAKSFYTEQAGFDLLVDIPNGMPGAAAPVASFA